MSSVRKGWWAAAGVDPRRFEAHRRGALRGWFAQTLGPARRTALLEDPDALLAAGTLLKDDRSSTVVALADAPLVLKRYRFPDALRALRRAPRRSRAQRAFLAALRLEAFGIGVAAPLAAVDWRCLGFGRASWLLSVALPGRDAGTLLADAALADAARVRLVDALLVVVERLQRARIAHGDLKASNFLVDGTAVWLLDLHGVRRVPWQGHAALARDRRRFLRNLEPWPELHARAASRLAEPDRRPSPDV